MSNVWIEDQNCFFFYIDVNIFIIEDTLHKIKKFLGQFFLGGCILIFLEIQCGIENDFARLSFTLPNELVTVKRSQGAIDSFGEKARRWKLVPMVGRSCLSNIWVIFENSSQWLEDLVWEIFESYLKTHPYGWKISSEKYLSHIWKLILVVGRFCLRNIWVIFENLS